MPEFGNGASSSISSSWEEDGVAPELLANIPVHLQSTMTATRDYFARLLFWWVLGLSSFSFHSLILVIN
jgi:hypothetical protein